MFEYVTLTVDWDHLQDVLNAQGSRGWHVVHMTSPRGNEYRVVLERQTPIVLRHGAVLHSGETVVAPDIARCGECSDCQPPSTSELVDAGVRDQTIDEYRGTTRCNP